ncbi:DPO3-like protein [Mya arenaria]|uniref:DPO3-like protein n=1 Tax=Mya arenaria TaxID=6604 RepID=A0ABY7F0C9_MYAAR|nr:DPO3-like protein [Mya arenaria]
MINAGVGESQISAIFAELNLPGISKTALKAREREIGPSIESVAEIACTTAIQQEMKLLQEVNNMDPTGDHVETDVSADGAWQKRGSNSLSGHVTVIGKLTKKCVSYSVAKKTCRTCKVAKRNKIKAKLHSCRKNWNGSSKAMEPFLTSTCLQEVKQKGLNIERLTMDGDSTTFTRVKRSLFPELKKSNDKNHIVKNFGNELYKLKSKHKSLSNNNIAHIQKCFSYGISQNKGSTHGIKTSLDALSSHMFNEHSSCSPTWCKSLRDENYRQAHILQGPELRKDFQNVIHGMLEILAHVQSTNANENMNHMVARKAPKTVTYSESESLDFRVSAAVAQKYDGRQYILQVNETHGLSPGHYTHRKCTVLDERRSNLAVKQKSVSMKRRRSELKAERMSKNFIDEVYEGKTYETAVGVSDIEIEHIEDIPPCPAECSETPHAYGQDDVIVFDLETTGLGTTSSIVQIAALHVSSGQHLNLFVKPKCGYIPTTASNITGLEFHGGVLYQHCKEVTSVAASEALLAFKRWLEAFGSHILLVAHNVMFDARLLVAKYQEEGITVPETIGFADSLRLFRTVYPGRQNYRLASLVHDIAGVDFGAHDASEDVYALSSILQLQTNLDKLSNYATTVSSVKFKLQELNNEKLYKGSYTSFVESKIISKAQATRLSRSGISIEHLKKVYSRSGLDGMQAVLKDRGAGKFYTKLASALDAVFSENKINLN